MFGFFLAGTIVNFVLMLLTPLALITRLFSLFLALLGGVAGLLITVAAVIATVISVAAKVALTAQDQLNISAVIGIKMFVFMWIASVLTSLAFLLQSALSCCCAPQRGNRSPRDPQDPQEPVEGEEGTEMAVTTPGVGPESKRTPLTLPTFIRRRKGGS